MIEQTLDEALDASTFDADGAAPAQPKEKRLPRVTISAGLHPRDTQVCIDGEPLHGLRRVFVDLSAEDALPVVCLELYVHALGVNLPAAVLVALADAEEQARGAEDFARKLDEDREAARFNQRSSLTGEEVLMNAAAGENDNSDAAFNLAERFFALPLSTRIELLEQLGLINQEEAQMARIDLPNGGPASRGMDLSARERALRFGKLAEFRRAIDEALQKVAALSSDAQRIVDRGAQLAAGFPSHVITQETIDAQRAENARIRARDAEFLNRHAHTGTAVTAPTHAEGSEEGAEPYPPNGVEG